MAGRFHPVTIGSLTLEGNLFLAPVAGFSDRAFRSMCIDEGANFTFTELISAESVIRSRPDLKPMDAPHPVNQLLRRADNETRYAIQLFGTDPARIAQGAAFLAPWRPAALDINSGCPVPKVVRSGAGSALMRDPANLGRVVEALVRASREHLGGVPVTIKMRSGWDSQSINYRECARIAVEAGAAMVSLHPRTRAQGYGGTSDWTHIADLAGRLSVPVTGSGDLYCPADAERMLRETGCAAVMFARGALGNPFIFPETRELLLDTASSLPGGDSSGGGDFNGGPGPNSSPGHSPNPDPSGGPGHSPTERMSAALLHLERLAADIGERRACRDMRKHFCAYTKGYPGQLGMPGGAALRNRLVHAETIAEYREAVRAAGISLSPPAEPEGTERRPAGSGAKNLPDK
ncbi:MAG: tRNA-dihydrouridine synthase [Treponema sp.]|nr:tRNA-dihydrouridine synthase [Treponema sp.]